MPRTLSAAPSELHFKFFGKDQGLHSGVVYCLFQDRQGFLWLGTRYGLRRFDGHTFRSYAGLPSDSANALGGPISSICEDASGLLWLAPAGGGVIAFDRKTNTTRYFRNYSDKVGISRGSIAALGLDDSKVLWALSNHWVMNRFDGNTGEFTQYHPQEKVASPGRYSFKMPPLVGGKFYLSTWGRSMVFDVRRRRYETIHEGILSGESLAWLQPVSGDTALAFPRVHDADPPMHLVQLSSAKALRSYRIPAAYPLSAASIYEGRTAYLLSERLGLISLDLRTGEWKVVPLSGLKYPASILIDKNENLWVGAAEGVYLSRGLGSGFERHILDQSQRTASSLTRTPVRALHAARDGLEAGTELGEIFRYEPDSRRFTFVERLRRHIELDVNSPMHQIQSDARGNTYYATTSGPLFIKHGQGKTRPFEGLQANFGYTTLVDDLDQLWIGMNRLDDLGQVPHAVVRFDSSRKNHRFYRLALPGRPDVEANHVFNLFQDRSGRLWAGSSAGLFEYDRGLDTFISRFHPRCDGSAQGPNNIWVIFEESRRRLWLGSWGRGLHLYDPVKGTYTDFTVENGLPSNNIQSILEDGNGNLWIGTSKGICRFDPNALTYLNFGRDDGLLDDEYQPKAAAKLPTGEMFFGGLNGITSFHPSKVRQILDHAPLVLTSLALGGKSHGQVVSGDTVTVQSGDNDLVFEYAILDFGSPDAKSYYYRLDGLEDDWNRSAGTNSGSYHNLPPGEYLLRIRGKNANNVWNPSELLLHVHVLPEYWQTAWFRGVLSGALLSAIGLVAIRRNKRRKHLQIQLDRAREQERHELAGDIHDGPLQDLYAVRFMIQDEHELGKLLANVRSDLRGISANLQTPRSTAALREALSTLIDAMAAKSETTFSFDIDTDLPELQDQVVQEFYRIIRTALTNVVKHAKATRCMVSLSHSNGVIEAIIADDGRGFDTKLTQLASEQFGIVLMTHYASQIGATLTIESQLQAGTTVTLRYKQRRKLSHRILPHRILPHRILSRTTHTS